MQVGEVRRRGVGTEHEGCGSAGEWEGALEGSDVADEGGAGDTV